MLIKTLDCGNHVQDQFYSELDSGIDYKATRYYRIIKHYREGKWSPERLENWFQERMRVYANLKENGLTRPIYVDQENKILDGNHRFAMLRTLGNKSVLIRRT